MSKYAEIQEQMRGYTKYKTHWNRERPYLCYVKNNEIFIYCKDPLIPNDYPYNQDSMYTTLINHYFTTKIFIGQDSGQCASSYRFNSIKYIELNILLNIY